MSHGLSRRYLSWFLPEEDDDEEEDEEEDDDDDEASICCSSSLMLWCWCWLLSSGGSPIDEARIERSEFVDDVQFRKDTNFRRVCILVGG